MGKYLNMIRQGEESQNSDRESDHRQSCPDEVLPLVRGSRVAWQGVDGKEHHAVVDFVHSSRGEAWAFCELANGDWCARNIKYLTARYEGATRRGLI